MSEPKKSTKVARQLKYSAPGADFLRRILDDGDDDGGAGVREPRPQRPRGPGPAALEHPGAEDPAAGLLCADADRISSR